MATEKLCSRCKKPDGPFGPVRRNKDGLDNYCRSCRRLNDAEHYARSPKRRAAIRANEKRCADLARDYVRQYLLNHSCVDCGETDPIVLEFDHVRGEKRNNIANLTSQGSKLETITAEIEKCEVRCANCHRRITHYRRLASVVQG